MRTRLVAGQQKSADLTKMLAEHKKKASLQDLTLSTHYSFSILMRDSLTRARDCLKTGTRLEYVTSKFCKVFRIFDFMKDCEWGYELLDEV